MRPLKPVAHSLLLSTLWAILVVIWYVVSFRQDRTDRPYILRYRIRRHIARLSSENQFVR
jgi:hypothetical protein